jgi:hypothetical protein
VTCLRSYSKSELRISPRSQPQFCYSSPPCFSSPLPISCCHLLPVSIKVHLGVTPEGQDQAQGAAGGAGRGQRERCCPPAPYSLPSSLPVPAPTCCQGSPPPGGLSPLGSHILLWRPPTGSEASGAGLPPAGLPGEDGKSPQIIVALGILLPSPCWTHPRPEQLHWPLCLPLPSAILRYKISEYNPVPKFWISKFNKML